MEHLQFEEMGYLLSKPQDKAGPFPTLLLLHGAGSRGRDLNALESNPFFSMSSRASRTDFPFLLFAPQCHKNSWFDMFEMLQRFVQMIAAHPLVDSSRIYLMGTSMGGYAAWQLAMTMPEYFAALVPLCGGGMYWNAWRLREIPIWAVHGKEDQTVFPEESEKMVAAVQRAGGNARLTMLEHTGHDCWTQAYASEELFAWLLQQKKGIAAPADSDLYNDSKKFG